ncbi:hypothetical protein ACIQFW_34075 [Streptomyces ardesiacus]|uniref:hypothetical protein n=1 Tax=Streptomyces ardesiacus TaxID=285564 RepID=UPI0037F4C1CE
MSETSATTAVASQYAAQVAGDLERNAKEQERIGVEIATLQEQLTALQHDHQVLVNIQQALAGAAPAATAENTSVPPPRRDAGAPSGGGRTRVKKGSAPAQGSKAKRAVGKKAAAAKAPAKVTTAKRAVPTLVELVRSHLTAQTEPRSAAEVTAALAQNHPERPVQATVVRNTLEGLVAKQQAQRTKRDSSVYYTAVGAPERAAASDGSVQSEKAK